MSSPLPSFTIRRPDGTLKSPEELRADASRIVAESQARAERMKTELTANVAEGTSRDQAATVAVTAVGGLQSVRLSDRVKSMTPAQIAAAVMQAYQDGATKVAARTREITATEMGDTTMGAEMQELMKAATEDVERPPS